jgi:hypothetical protein
MKGVLWQAQLRKHINANAPVVWVGAATEPGSISEDSLCSDPMELCNRRPGLLFILTCEGKRK